MAVSPCTSRRSVCRGYLHAFTPNLQWLTGWSFLGRPEETPYDPFSAAELQMQALMGPAASSPSPSKKSSGLGAMGLGMGVSMADSIRTEGTGRESPDFEFSLGLFEDEEGRLSREKSPEHGLLSSSVGNGYSSVSNGLSGRDYLSKGIGSPSPRRANEGRWSWENSSNASPERTSLGLTSSLFRKPSWSSSPRETLADTPTRESPSWSSLVQKSATKDGHNWSSSTRESPSRDTRSWSSPARDSNHQDSQSYGSHRWSSPARSSPSRDDANLDSKSLNNHRLSSPSRSSPLRDNINQDNHSNSHRWPSLSPARDTADPDTQSLGNNRWSSPSRSSPTRTTSALDSNQRSSAARDVEGSSCLGSYNRSPSRDSSNTTSLSTHDVDRWSSPTRDTPTPATHSSPRTAVKRYVLRLVVISPSLNVGIT